MIDLIIGLKILFYTIVLWGIISSWIDFTDYAIHEYMGWEHDYWGLLNTALLYTIIGIIIFTVTFTPLFRVMGLDPKDFV